MNEIYDCLPFEVEQKIKGSLHEGNKINSHNLQEIRLRIGKKIEINSGQHTILLSYCFTKEDAVHLLNRISQYSLYTIEEELRLGYVTIEGGHRIGLAGKVILDSGQVKMIRNVSSFNIRIARQVIGVAEKLVPFLFEKKWLSTIFVGPPQSGKTTLLRDLARVISTGSIERNISAYKVGIVDERSEIAGCVNGVPQHQFGERIDVLDSCPKREGMMMMIRSMSPQILIVDEIGHEKDGAAIAEAVNAGISLAMSAHGDSLEDCMKRKSLREIIENGAFQRIVFLNDGKTRKYSIYSYDKVFTLLKEVFLT